MGVPGFYRWLVQRYPLIRRRMSDCARPRIDNFYIDFNCIIYNCNRFAALDPTSTTSLIPLFEEICRYLDILVQLIAPQSVLYIAVDGPAPFAKCAQQRTRRFLSALHHQPGTFDGTQVSVGTEFMESLHQYLLHFFERKTKEDPTWNKPQLIYSSYRTPGEGEHKFFEYIRHQKTLPTWDPNRTHCVYSPDADLIFLCLETTMPYFYIMREWLCWVGPNEQNGNAVANKLLTSAKDFELLSMPVLRDYFLRDYASNDQKSLDRVIGDFTAFSFFVGNDFIPHFHDCVIQQGDFEKVVQVYQDTVRAKNLWLVTPNGFDRTILHDFLLAVVAALSGPKNFGKNPNQNAQNQRKGIKFDRNALEEAREYLRQKYPLEMRTDPSGFEKKIADSILDAFDWVLLYYTRGCPSWTWFFPYLYAPPLAIVAQYAGNHVSNFELDRPPLPFEQLLCILPPQSSYLLPPSLGNSMTDNNSPIKKFYPMSFKIDLNGAKFEYMGVVVIPFVDQAAIRELVAENTASFKPEEVQRNTLIPPFVFFPGSNGVHSTFDLISTASPPISHAIPPAVSSLYEGLLPISGSLQKAKVMIFSRPSSSESYVLEPRPESWKNQSELQSAVESLHKIQSSQNSQSSESPPNPNQNEIGKNEKIVLADWPYLKPSLLVGPTKMDSFETNKGLMTIGTLKKSAIDVSRVNEWVDVRPLAAANLAETRFVWGEVIHVPFSLTLPLSAAPLILERFRSVPQSLAAIGDTVVISSGRLRGSLAKIESINAEKGTAAIVSCGGTFAKIAKLLADDDECWAPLEDFAARYGLPEDSFARVLETIPLSPKDGDNVLDAALTLSFNNQVLEGICALRSLENSQNQQNSPKKKRRKVQKTYMYSQEIVPVLDEYFRRAPGMAEVLLESGGDERESNKVDVEEVFNVGSEKIAMEKARELSKWIKTGTPFSCHFLVSPQLETVSQQMLRVAEQKVEGADGSKAAPFKMEIAIEELIGKGMAPKNSEEPEIGKRAVYIEEKGSTPFGMGGTIVAIDREFNEISVLADSKMEFGTLLRNRLRTKRGYIAKTNDCFIYTPQ